MLCVVPITFLGFYFPQAWLTIFLSVVSWVVADFIVVFFEIDRRGVIHLKFDNPRLTISLSSWAVVPYLVGIILGSLLGEIGGAGFLALIKSYSESARNPQGAFFGAGSMIIYVMVFLDV